VRNNPIRIHYEPLSCCCCQSVDERKWRGLMRWMANKIRGGEKFNYLVRRCQFRWSFIMHQSDVSDSIANPTKRIDPPPPFPAPPPPPFFFYTPLLRFSLSLTVPIIRILGIGRKRKRGGEGWESFMSAN
jgi:hypothetical protein